MSAFPSSEIFGTLGVSSKIIRFPVEKLCITAVLGAVFDFVAVCQERPEGTFSVKEVFYGLSQASWTQPLA
jgi:hypothetical protein